MVHSHQGYRGVMFRYCIVLLFTIFGKLFAQSSSIDTGCIPIVTITESQNNICMGAAVKFYATVANEGTSGVYKWKKSDHTEAVNNNASYTFSNFHDSDVVVCEYSCKTLCGVDTTVASNPITIQVINDIAPTISVANNDSLICEGQLTVFTATAHYGNAVPSYQWMVNGSPVGGDSAVFPTYSLTNGSRVECVLTISMPSCPGYTRSTTSQMTIYVYPMVHPAITIKPSKTPICRGEEVTFTATANGGEFPSFTWKINGRPTGANAASLTTSTLKDGDTVSCTVTIDIDSRCHTDTISAPSNDVVMHVYDFTDPSLKIASSALDVCEGKPVTFTATPENAGDNNFYEWKVNDQDAGNHSTTFVNDNFMNGDKVYCTLSTNIPGCPITAKVSSNTEVVSVKTTPVITFSPPDISVMFGTPAQLHASVSGNASSILWTPPEALTTPQSLTSYTIPLTQDTVFNLTVADTNGCTASKDLDVKVLHKLYMPSAFTPNKDGKNDVFRIPLDASIILQEFSVFNRWGNVVFSTKDITKGWNGTYNNKDLDTGTYVYIIKGKVEDKAVTLKGTVTLIR